MSSDSAMTVPFQVAVVMRPIVLPGATPRHPVVCHPGVHHRRTAGTAGHESEGAPRAPSIPPIPRSPAVSQAARPPDPDDPRRGMRVRPQRGRALFLGTFVGLIVLVFAIILLVSQCANSDG